MGLHKQAGDVQMSAASVTVAVEFMADALITDALDTAHTHPRDPVLLRLMKDASFVALLAKYDAGRTSGVSHLGDRSWWVGGCCRVERHGVGHGGKWWAFGGLKKQCRTCVYHYLNMCIVGLVRISLPHTGLRSCMTCTRVARLHARVDTLALVINNVGHACQRYQTCV